MNSDNKAKSARKKVNWIQDAIIPSHAGLLHKTLHVPQGTKIPVAKLKVAATGNSPTAKRARLALTLRSFH